MGRSLTTLIVAPHPDDEVVAAGIWMSRQPAGTVHIVHVTDGSPRDVQNALALGFSGRAAYARARKQELARALSLAGILPAQCERFGFVDKEAYLHLPDFVARLQALIARIQPNRVFSPAYEGGHPDHDAAALAVAVLRRSAGSFDHWEFPLYHAGTGGRMIAGGFIGGNRRRAGCTIVLTREERLLKQRMISCFATQKEILSNFKARREHFRPAIFCDFTRAPHRGPLLYERWQWGITGAEWRRRASEFLAMFCPHPRAIAVL